MTLILIYEDRLKNFLADQDTLIECDLTESFFFIIPIAVHTLLPLVFQYLDPIDGKVFNHRYDVIVLIFQSINFLAYLCINSNFLQWTECDKRSTFKI